MKGSLRFYPGVVFVCSSSTGIFLWGSSLPFIGVKGKVVPVLN
jgi:hypothetical protein